MVHNVFIKSMNTYMPLTMTWAKLKLNVIAERARGGQGNQYA